VSKSLSQRRSGGQQSGGGGERRLLAAMVLPWEVYCPICSLSASAYDCLGTVLTRIAGRTTLGQGVHDRADKDKYRCLPSVQILVTPRTISPTPQSCSAPTPHNTIANVTNLPSLISFCTGTRDPLLPSVWGELKKGEDPYAPPEQGCCVGECRVRRVLLLGGVMRARD
jgi:hypothetical protein